MLQFTYPGVYTRKIPSGVHTIAGAPTSVALFVGPTRAGIDAQPIRLLNYGDFERSFGGLSQTSALSYSVLHFFANGGGQAFVIRVPAKDAVPAVSTVLSDAAVAAPSLVVTALSSGLSSNKIFVEFDDFDIQAAPFTATPDKKRFNISVTDSVMGRVERFSNLSTASASARFAPSVVNDVATGSKLIKLGLTGAAIDAEAPQANGSAYKITVPPVAGAFAGDIALKLTVVRRAADGAPDAANTITGLAVTVFATGVAKPASPVELVTRLVAALNAAVRGSAQAAKLDGTGIEDAVFEGGTLLRLRIAAPAAEVGEVRLHDATVTISDPVAGTSFLTPYFGPAAVALVANPSRYRLGQPYAASQISAQSKGADGDATGQPDSDVFKAAVAGLETPDAFFNILCLPDLVRPSASDPMALQHGNAVATYAEAARICALKFAVLLIDPPLNVIDTGTAAAWKSTTLGLSSNQAATYFPNIKVDDPLEPGSIRSHPPSGAGVYARTDAQLRLKFQVQHPRPTGHRMLRWTDEASTSAARTVA